MAITIQPNMTQPVPVTTGSTPLPGTAMPVQFTVRTPSLPNATPILINICIIIIVGGVTVRIYIGKNVLADGQLTTLETILPIGSVIESMVSTYQVAYPPLG